MSTAAASRPFVGPFLAGAGYVAGFAVAAPAAHALLGAGLDRFLPSPSVGPAARIAGAAVAAVGLGVLLLATMELVRTGRGLPLSSSPPRRLVAGGVYSLSRHPIYVGAVLLLSGTGLLASSFWIAVAAGPLLLAFLLCYACGIEEPTLVDRYGPGYEEYRQRTPLIVAFPFRRALVRLAARLLERFSAIADEPGIVRMDAHLLFWSYGVWPAVGVGLGLAVTERALGAGGLGSRDTALFIAALTVVGLAGTRFAWRAATALGRTRSFEETADVVGFVSWGAAGGVLLAALLLGLVSRSSPLLVVDAALPGLIVAHVFGRIGCAFYGCCYGKETSGPFRLRYTHPALKAVREGRVDPRSVLPVQLLSSAWGLVVATLVLGASLARPLPAGVPAALTAALYGFCRFDEEWLRVAPRGSHGLVSPPQLAALALAAGGLAGLLLAPAAPAAGIGSVPVLPQGQPVPGPLCLSVLAGSALLTFLVFSYHRNVIGRWR